MTWSYGVTTVPARRDSLLPRTLKSLRAAGFDRPRLFVDGGRDSDSWADEFGLDVTVRTGPPVKAYANWVLALWELFAREPMADRFAVFQDDVLVVKNLRGYLERVPLLDGGKVYWNLFTYPPGRQIELPRERGFHKSNQLGRGALGLVFDRQGVVDLLGSRFMAERPLDPDKGTRNLDGGVLQTLKGQGYTEMVHRPSLTEHLGEESTIDRPGGSLIRVSADFPGEGFDAMDLITSGV